MKEERLTEFMEKVDIKCKDIALYTNKEKGIIYPLSLASLLVRVDYLELTKEELERAKFEQKIEKKDYQMYDCEKVVSKYEITKVEADRFTLTTKKIKATHIWNVSNQLGIYSTFENKEDAFKLCEEINNKVIEFFK
jgi:hypothetical protein